jgi:hypothetical protein
MKNLYMYINIKANKTLIWAAELFRLCSGSFHQKGSLSSPDLIKSPFALQMFLSPTVTVSCLMFTVLQSSLLRESHNAYSSAVIIAEGVP